MKNTQFIFYAIFLNISIPGVEAMNKKPYTFSRLPCIATPTQKTSLSIHSASKSLLPKVPIFYPTYLPDLCDDVLLRILSFLKPSPSSNMRAQVDLINDIAVLRDVSKKLRIFIDQEMKRIFTGTLWNIRDKGLTIMQIAAQNGYSSIIRALLTQERGQTELINMNRRENGPLFLATHNGHAKVLYIMLMHKPMDNFIDYTTGNTLLHIAAQQGHAHIVKMLLARKARIKIINHTGETPLHKAATRGNPAILQTLLEYEADANAADFSGNTPMHAATYNHSLPALTVRRIVQILITHGARPEIKNDDEKTILDLIRKNKMSTLARSLKKALAARERREILLKTLLEYLKPKPIEIIMDYDSHNNYLKSCSQHITTLSAF